MENERLTSSGLEEIHVYLDVLTDESGRPITFSAMTDGRRWNGWATPYFEKGEADRLVDEFNRRNQSIGRPAHARYEQDDDVYVFVDEDLDPPEERFGTVVIEGRRLYSIGAAVWCWSAVGDFGE